MLTRYYEKNQVWIPGENDLTLKYVDAESADLELYVANVFCILPVGHPKNPTVPEKDLEKDPEKGLEKDPIKEPIKEPIKVKTPKRKPRKKV